MGVSMNKPPLLLGLALCLVMSLISSASPAEVTTGNTAGDVVSCIIRPRQVVQLASSISGRIAEEFVDRGDTVSQGQVVAKLESSIEEAQLALDRYKAANSTEQESAETDLGFNERQLARKQKLRDNMFAKIDDVDDYTTRAMQDDISIRKAQINQHLAALEAVRSAGALNLRSVKSSVDGVVTERKLQPGEYVYEQTPIMTIAQIDPLSVELVVSAQRYGTIKVGQLVEIHPNPPVGGVYRVKVDVVDPIIDAASETFGVRLILPNPERAIPAGIRCSAQLPKTAATPE
jgi:RND family efflux transporter MFP subunit